MHWVGFPLALALALPLLPAGARGLRDAGLVRENYRGALLAFPLGAVLATAALALSQVNRVIAAVHGQAAAEPGPPQTLNATLEFDLHSGAIVTRQWAKHPLCSC